MAGVTGRPCSPRSTLLRWPWDMPASRATRRSGTAALSRTDRNVGPSYSLAGGHCPDRGAGTGPTGPSCALTCLLPRGDPPRSANVVRLVRPPGGGTAPRRTDGARRGADTGTLPRRRPRRTVSGSAEVLRTIPAARGGPPSAPKRRGPVDPTVGVAPGPREEPVLPLSAGARRQGPASLDIAADHARIGCDPGGQRPAAGTANVWVASPPTPAGARASADCAGPGGTAGR